MKKTAVGKDINADPVFDNLPSIIGRWPATFAEFAMNRKRNDCNANAQCTFIRFDPKGNDRDRYHRDDPSHAVK